MPVPAGMRWPMMMFSFYPSKSSRAPRIAASVNTRVVSWNDAAEMNDCVVRLALVIPRSNGSLVGGLPPFFTTRSFASENVCLSTFSPCRNSVAPGSTIFTICSIWRTITPMCLSLIFTPCSRYTSWTSLSRYSCTARGPLIRRMSCGFTGPSVRRSPARTRSPSCTRKCLPAATSYSCGPPSSGWSEIAQPLFLLSLLLDDLDVRMQLLLPVFDDHPLAPPGELVQLLPHRLLLDDVHEPHHAPHVRHDRVGVGVPREQHGVAPHLGAV